MPDRINSYFANIGAKLTSKFPTIPAISKRFVPRKNPETVDITIIEKHEVLANLDKMSIHKSSGMTNINSLFIMGAIKILADKFTYLYNITLTTGIYPQDWKVAMVTPIPKIPQPKTCSDLRPISILPLPGRILEKIINATIIQHLECTKYLADQQNGFRRNRSTSKTVATLIDRLL